MGCESARETREGRQVVSTDGREWSGGGIQEEGGGVEAPEQMACSASTGWEPGPRGAAAVEGRSGAVVPGSDAKQMGRDGWTRL